MIGAMWSLVRSRRAEFSAPAGAFVSPRPLARAVFAVLVLDITGFLEDAFERQRRGGQPA